MNLYEALELHDRAISLERIAFELRRRPSPHQPLTPAVSVLASIIGQISDRVTKLLPSPRAPVEIVLLRAYTDTLDQLGEAVTELGRAQQYVNAYFIAATRRTAATPKFEMPPEHQSYYTDAIDTAVGSLDLACSGLHFAAAELAPTAAPGGRAVAALARSGPPMNVQPATALSEPATAAASTSRVRRSR
ncbi:hypothetical protein [Streptacidiphilus sp. MAP5-52]|uniref:hypothetical protein n=1 Tax=Streptacidiphilus sp. MAP5-52 TaxID=3156267 RepID=UPI003513FB9F